MFVLCLCGLVATQARRVNKLSSSFLAVDVFFLVRSTLEIRQPRLPEAGLCQRARKIFPSKKIEDISIIKSWRERSPRAYLLTGSLPAASRTFHARSSIDHGSGRASLHHLCHSFLRHHLSVLVSDVELIMYNYFMLGKIADLLRQCSALLFPRCEVLHCGNGRAGCLIIYFCFNNSLLGQFKY